MKIKVLLAMIACVAMLVACTDKAAEAETELWDTITKIASIGADSSKADHDYFFEHTTDNFIRGFGYPTEEACRADIEECIGDPLDPPVRANLTFDYEKSPLKAEMLLSLTEIEEGETFKMAFEVGFINDDGVWKADTMTAGDDEIPSGTPLVKVELNEMAFIYDTNDKNLLSGKFAFDIHNAGEQVHELVLVKIIKDGSLMDFFMNEDMEAFEFLGVKVPILPNRSAKMAVGELSAGRYGLVCFLPDQSVPGGEGPPHMAMGMISEFTVE
tara:strand:- start:367 stop:1179 length:813 start_codon:yes stop_codon:yes gene_type:complete